MVNALWRLVLMLIFLLSLGVVLAITWDVPRYLGYELPGDFSKLPMTLLILLAMVTGIWWIWSRPKPKASQVDTRMHYTSQIVPKEDVFASLPPKSWELSPVEQANQTEK